MTNLSLYQLIKQKSQEKGRPLKIICDWDECLQPTRPLVIYTECQIEGSFSNFFHKFWESSAPSAHSANIMKIVGDISSIQEEKMRIEEFERKRTESRKNPEAHDYAFHRIDDFYYKAPFLTTVDNLLETLKEGLIEELIIMSSYRKGMGSNRGGWKFINRSAEVAVNEKTGVYLRTFAKFPQAKLSLTGATRNKNGNFFPYRWEVIRDNYADFDIFIDDNPNIMKEALKNHLPNQRNKTYAMPNYLCNRDIKNANCYLFPVDISGLTVQDFEIATLELKVKDLEKKINTIQVSQRKRENIWKQPYLYLTFASGMGIFLLALGIYHWIRKGKSLSKK